MGKVWASPPQDVRAQASKRSEEDGPVKRGHHIGFWRGSILTAQHRAAEPEKGKGSFHPEDTAPHRRLEPKLGKEGVCLGEAQHGGSEP